jgi:chromosome partitioning protein
MIVGVASYKGGVGKTTTAVHLAEYLQSTEGATVLLDGDTTRNATGWSTRGPGFRFPVAPVEAAAKLARKYRHLVIDTGQKPNENDLLALAQYTDLLILPSIPSALDTDGLGQTIRALRTIRTPEGEAVKFKVLLTRVAPDSAKQVAELREILGNGHVPVFAAEIPRLKAFEKAAAAGVLVGGADDERAARGWEAYAAVGEEMLHAADGVRR